LSSDFQEIEGEVYGENSLEVAKTAKIVGTIHILSQNFDRASRYLAQSFKIFSQNGAKKQMQEVSEKLNFIKQKQEHFKKDF